MSNQPSETEIVNMLQSVGEICTGTMYELGNQELFFTEDNIRDWRTMHHELSGIYDKLSELVERSKYPDPMPAEYDERPIYGVTNGRGRIIA